MSYIQILQSLTKIEYLRHCYHFFPTQIEVLKFSETIFSVNLECIKYIKSKFHKNRVGEFILNHLKARKTFEETPNV